MAKKPQDRITQAKLKTSESRNLFDPELKVVSGEARLADPTLEAKFEQVKSEREEEIKTSRRKLTMPPLATYLVGQAYPEQKKGMDDSCASHVAGVYCSCNKVNACSCVGQRRSSGGGTICTCVPVH
jgi:hypothetical protein